MEARPRRFVGFPGFPGATYGPADQQRRIAESISRIDAAAHNAFLRMQKMLDAELDKLGDELREESAESDDQLREHLRCVLAGSIAYRVSGAVLLLVGILLAMAGSVVGTLSS
jgi:hypothetical protein